MSDAVREMSHKAALPEIEEIAAKLILPLLGRHHETSIIALMRVMAMLICQASDREGREEVLEAVVAALRHRVRTLGT